jgi:hypothetical protein
MPGSPRTGPDQGRAPEFANEHEGSAAALALKSAVASWHYRASINRFRVRDAALTQ